MRGWGQLGRVTTATSSGKEERGGVEGRGGGEV